MASYRDTFTCILLPLSAEILSSRLLFRNIKIRIQKTIILLVVLYRYKTWPLTLREERKLRVFEKKMLRTFRPKGNEVMGSWRKLHNEELHYLYSSPSLVAMTKAKKMRCAGHVA
jgi:hypothetical protein